MNPVAVVGAKQGFRPGSGLSELRVELACGLGVLVQRASSGGPSLFLLSPCCGELMLTHSSPGRLLAKGLKCSLCFKPPFSGDPVKSQAETVDDLAAWLRLHIDPLSASLHCGALHEELERLGKGESCR